MEFLELFLQNLLQGSAHDLRKCEVTMNIKTAYLIGGANSIFDHPDDPMVNIYHLHDQGVDPKGAGYLDERSATEDVLFMGIPVYTNDGWRIEERRDIFCPLSSRTRRKASPRANLK